MNKKIIRIAALALALLLMFAACGKNNETEETQPIEETVQVTQPNSSDNTEVSATESDKEIITNTQPEETQETVETTAVPESGENWGEIDETKPNETESGETVPAETKPAETKPAETAPANPQPGQLTYAQYISMSSAEQQKYYESFESVDAFLEWYDAALAEYEANNEYIDISGGNVDIGDLME